MRTIRAYTTQLAAELARLPLEHAGIPTMIVGIDVGMEGGAAGVQLLVPEALYGSSAEVARQCMMSLSSLVWRSPLSTETV